VSAAALPLPLPVAVPALDSADRADCPFRLASDDPPATKDTQKVRLG
jgi:hypothetical protein